MTVAGARASGWICCHLGAREHYAVPRALRRQQRLAQLITDAWAPPGSIWRAIPGARSKRLAERFHDDLADVPVTEFTGSLLVNEIGWNVSARSGWDLFMARNQWFQRHAAGVIRTVAADAPIVFAHSYAALAAFRAARSRGWRCILGQIDPGDEHFHIVARAAAAAPAFGPPPPPPPASYWRDWREEWALADRVVVNSEWSRTCLERAGVPPQKLVVIPLAYGHADRGAHVRAYPEAFTASRPLRLLFVGQVTVAKGAQALLEAMALATDLPIELLMVGGGQDGIPLHYLRDRRIRFAGAVPRSAVMAHYREADVLIFPSLSDGFGMAQVEAQGWGLPIIASRSCGDVIIDGVNGLRLPEVTADAIAAAIRTVAARPGLLADFSQHADRAATNSIQSLGEALVALEAA